MQLNNLKRVHKLEKRAPVGRGGKRGKTSGRGTKGQKARAGHKIRPEFRDVIMRMPKLRGRGTNSFVSIGKPVVTIGLAVLASRFSNGSEITPKLLSENGLISATQLKFSLIKVVGKMELQKPLKLKGLMFSKSVRESVEKAGGSVSN